MKEPVDNSDFLTDTMPGIVGMQNADHGDIVEILWRYCGDIMQFP